MESEVPGWGLVCVASSGTLWMMFEPPICRGTGPDRHRIPPKYTHKNSKLFKVDSVNFGCVFSAMWSQIFDDNSLNFNFPNCEIKITHLQIYYEVFARRIKLLTHLLPLSTIVILRFILSMGQTAAQNPGREAPWSGWGCSGITDWTRGGSDSWAHSVSDLTIFHDSKVTWHKDVMKGNTGDKVRTLCHPSPTEKW